MQVDVEEDLKTQKIRRQHDTISPKPFTFSMEDIFKTLTCEEKGIRIDDIYLTHQRFADDIVLISRGLNELKELLNDLKVASENVGLCMNMSKTKGSKS